MARRRPHARVPRSRGTTDAIGPHHYGLWSLVCYRSNTTATFFKRLGHDDELDSTEGHDSDTGLQGWSHDRSTIDIIIDTIIIISDSRSIISIQSINTDASKDSNNHLTSHSDLTSHELDLIASAVVDSGREQWRSSASHSDRDIIVDIIDPSSSHRHASLAVKVTRHSVRLIPFLHTRSTSHDDDTAARPCRYLSLSRSLASNQQRSQSTPSLTSSSSALLPPSDRAYEYSFDRIFRSSVTTQEVYDHAAEGLVWSCMDGFNGACSLAPDARTVNLTAHD